MLYMTKEDYEKILNHCKEGLPNESCGLIGGTVEGNDKYIKKVYLALPLRNEIRIDTVDKNGNTRSFTERYKNAKDCRARMNELKRKLNIF